MSLTEDPKEKILSYVNNELLFGEDEAASDEDLLESGLLDSISIFGLVQFVRDSFGIEVPPQDIIIDHFGSVDQIVAYVNRRLIEVA